MENRHFQETAQFRGCGRLINHSRNSMSAKTLKQFILVALFCGLALSASAVGTPPSSLSGFVYLDQNNSGVFDAGDTGLSGVTVTLTGTDNSGNAVNVTTNTLAD